MLFLVEEKLIFNLLLKLIVKEPKLVSELTKDAIEKIKDYNTKDKIYLQETLKYIMNTFEKESIHEIPV